MESLPVYPTSSAQRYAESEAKLKKALERNAAREDLTGVVTAAGATPVPTPPSLQPQPQSPIPSLVGQGHYQQPPYPPRTLVPHPVYSEPSSPISHSPPIMMRSRQKPTYWGPISCEKAYPLECQCRCSRSRLQFDGRELRNPSRYTAHLFKFQATFLDKKTLDGAFKTQTQQLHGRTFHILSPLSAFFPIRIPFLIYKSLWGPPTVYHALVHAPSNSFWRSQSADNARTLSHSHNPNLENREKKSTKTLACPHCNKTLIPRLDKNVTRASLLFFPQPRALSCHSCFYQFKEINETKELGNGNAFFYFYFSQTDKERKDQNGFWVFTEDNGGGVTQFRSAGLIRAPLGFIRSSAHPLPPCSAASYIIWHDMACIFPPLVDATRGEHTILRDL